MIARIVLGSLLSVALVACSSNSGSSGTSSQPPKTHAAAHPAASRPAAAASVATHPIALSGTPLSTPSALAPIAASSTSLVTPPGLAGASSDSVPAVGTSAAPPTTGQTAAELAAAHPAPAGASAAVAEVTAKLAAAHPDVAGSVLQVSRIGLPNSTLYEIVTPQAILYTDKDVDYLLVGRLLVGEGAQVEDLTSRPALKAFLASHAPAAAPESATAPEASSPSPDGESGSKAVFDALPFATGWTTVYGVPAGHAVPASHHVVVFEDPDCEFCQKLAADLPAIGAQVGGLSVTVFPFVLETKHPNGLAHARALVCAANPGPTWAEWMLFANGKDTEKAWAQWSPKHAPNGSCPRAKLIDAWQTAGHALGFSSTPTLMFPSGATVAGALTADQFMQAFRMLDANPASWTNPSPAAGHAPQPAVSAVTTPRAAPAPTVIPPPGPNGVSVPRPMRQPASPVSSLTKTPSGIRLNDLLGPAAGCSADKPCAAPAAVHPGK